MWEEPPTPLIRYEIAKIQAQALRRWRDRSGQRWQLGDMQYSWVPPSHQRQVSLVSRGTLSRWSLTRWWTRQFLPISVAGPRKIVVVAIQSLSRVWLFATPWTAALQASLSFTISWSWLKYMSIESVMLSNHFIFSHSLLLLSSVFPRIMVFSSGLAFHIRWPRHWSFSFSVHPSSEYSGLISFGIDWFGLLAIQGLSRVFSNTTVRKHQFFSTQSSLWSNSHICTWLLEQRWLFGPLSAKWCLYFLIHCLGLSWLSFQEASIF